MKKHFYSHLVEIETLTLELDGLNLSKKEREHLENLIHSNIHAAVLDGVLSQIPIDDKKLFLEHIAKNDHDKTWDFLNKRSINVEAKVKKIIRELQKELLLDIRSLKQSKAP